MQTVHARQLKAMLHDGAEIALLDVREEGVFAKRHLLLAASAPLSRLELRVPLLVPRRATRVVICDGGENLAQRAARKLADYGYNNVSTLAGGIDAWAAAGYEIYSGVNVPSKAFGEFVEHNESTPRMDAREIQSRVAAGDPLVILDSRPLAEYSKMSIPGGIDCPGAELVYRIHDVIPSPDALVVVNCAGRTRSIIGAQSLINAGIPNRVVALKDGTMGWHLAGFQLARDQTKVAPQPSNAGIAKAKQAAARVARRFGVKIIDVETVAQFAREMNDRTLYLFDVRSPEEYAAGHLHSTINAPGGQLVQATDTFAATRNARMVLIDDHGVRAIMTASWLIQMGWRDVFVVKNALQSGPMLRGSHPPSVPGLSQIRCNFISPQPLARQIAAGHAAVIDLDTSLSYRDGHIPGAWLAIRANLESDLKRIPPSPIVALTSSDGIVAQLASIEAKQYLPAADVRVVRGGTAAWRTAGLPLEQGMTHVANNTEDVWYRPYDRTSNVEEAMKDYLSWEVNLLKQIARDDDITFRAFPR
jgi:rhodanese-related sulfurtransferase